MDADGFASGLKKPSDRSIGTVLTVLTGLTVLTVLTGDTIDRRTD